MDALIGWALFLGFALVFVLFLRIAGPGGDAKPSCGIKDGKGSGGGCH